MTEGTVVFEPAGVSTESLATLGEGSIAYVKQIRSEDVPVLFPQAPKIAPGLKLFALHAADGVRIHVRARSRTPLGAGRRGLGSLEIPRLVPPLNPAGAPRR